MNDVKAMVFIVRYGVKVVSRFAGLLTKLVVMVSSNVCQQALTRGPLCCTFMLGFKVEIAACFKRSN